MASPRRWQPLGNGLSSALVALAIALGLWALPVVQRFEAQSYDGAFQLLGPVAEAPEDVVLLVIDSKSLFAMRSFWAPAEPAGAGGDAGAGGEDPGPGGEEDVREEEWPWHRFLYGALTDFLARSGAAAVGIDLVFSGKSSHEEDGDRILAESFFRRAVSQGGRTYLATKLEALPEEVRGEVSPYLRRLREREDRLLERAAIEVREETRLPFEAGSFQRAQVPYGGLAEPSAVTRLGVVNGTRDPDDSVRRAFLLVRQGERLLPSLGLSVLLDRLAVEEVRVDASGDLWLDDRRVPLDEDGRLLLDWYGAADAFPAYTIHEVIKVALADHEHRLARLAAAGAEGDEEGAGEGAPASTEEDEILSGLVLGWGEKISPEAVEAWRERVRGKIVLIGANAPELGDVYAMPYSSVFPGVGIHATVIENVLRGDFARRAPVSVRFGILLVLTLAAGLGPGLVGGEKRGFGLYLALLAGYAALFAVCFRAGPLWIDLVVPVVAVSLAYGVAQLLEYLQTGRDKRKLRSTFTRVLQPDLVEQVLEDPEMLSLEKAETRELTVLFSDLQNSTALSEKFSPKEWVARLNRYFTEITQTVKSRQGYLDKFIGDGVMCVWGAPVPIERQAETACLTAVELREQLERLQEEMREEHDVELVTRLGINTGSMLVGFVGGEKIAHYTVMGDEVVIASRLESANKFFGTRTLIGEGAWEKANGAVEGREVDRVVLKGKTRAIGVWEPLGRRGELTREQQELIARYDQAMALYRERRWDEAIDAFQAVFEVAPGDGPSELLIARCRACREEPPPEGWGGEFAMTTK